MEQSQLRLIKRSAESLPVGDFLLLPKIRLPERLLSSESGHSPINNDILFTALRW